MRFGTRRGGILWRSGEKSWFNFENFLLVSVKKGQPTRAGCPSFCMLQ